MESKKISNDEYHFIFENSSHTIGRILQMELLKDPDTVFAGYTKSHPLETQLVLKLKTVNKTPREILNNTMSDIINKLETIRETAVESF